MPKLPDGNLGSAEVSKRYGVSGTRARQILYRIREAGFLVESVSRRLIVRESAIKAWEAREKAAGRPLPGIRPRGPKARTAPKL